MAKGNPVLGRPKAAPALLVAVLLLSAIVAVFSPLPGYDFVNYDDPFYVTSNPVVADGLTVQGLQWAFTSAGYASNWHPLTWLSHMLDVSLFGMTPGKQHLMNLFVHSATTLLLFLVLARMSGRAWSSAVAAALFAIHPLHVESVAWVSERKDLLCAFFWVLTMGAYAWYLSRKTVPRYTAVLLCYVLSLLSKPFAVTLPLVLILLDYWPFGRFRSRTVPGLDAVPAITPLQSVLEKVPFFLLSAASGLITILAQRAGGGFSNLDEFPFLVRVDNAVLSYVRYLGKMIWPTKLAVFYPHAGVRLPFLEVAAALLALIGITLLALRYRRTRPYIAVGWFWYLITLITVIGLMHVGSHAMADRYSYVSLIGPFVGISWWTRDVWSRRGGGRILPGVAIALSLLLAGMSRHQVRHWKDSISLFLHAIEVTERNWLAHNNLGVAYMDLQDYDKAVFHFTSVLRISPSLEQAQRNRAYALRLKQISHGNRSLLANSLSPQPPRARERLAQGNELVKEGRLEEAVQAFSEAVAQDPGLVEALNNMGGALLRLGRLEESAGCFERALTAQPGRASLHFNLALVLETSGKLTEAGQHYRQAILLKPDDQRARNALAALEKRDRRE